MYSEQELKKVKNWLLTNELPHFKREADKNRFLKKYSGAKLKSRNSLTFVYIGHKQIISNESVQSFLERYFDDPAHIVTGQQRLYKTLQKKYIGITQRHVNDFLINLTGVQVRKPKKKNIVNKTIRSNKSNEK